MLSEVEGGVFAATQVSSGGCGVAGAKGVYFWLKVGTGKWTATEDLGMCVCAFVRACVWHLYMYIITCIHAYLHFLFETHFYL